MHIEKTSKLELVCCVEDKLSINKLSIYPHGQFSSRISEWLYVTDLMAKVSVCCGGFSCPLHMKQLSRNENKIRAFFIL